MKPFVSFNFLGILEIGVVVKAEVVDQIRDDESGELVLGPGTGGLQPRVSEARRALPKLIREQEEKLAQAKRFAMEQSVQHVSYHIVLKVFTST